MYFSIYSLHLNLLGSILVNQINNNYNGFPNFKPEIIVCNDEIELVNTFFQLVNNWDPEVICGYEVSIIKNIRMYNILSGITYLC